MCELFSLLAEAVFVEQSLRVDLLSLLLINSNCLHRYLYLSSGLRRRQARVDPTQNVRDDQFLVDVIQQVVKVAFVKFNRFVSRPGGVIEELAPTESGGLVSCTVQDQ